MPKKHPRMKHPSARQLAPVIDALAKKANFEWMPTNVFLLQSAVYGFIEREEFQKLFGCVRTYGSLLQIASLLKPESESKRLHEMGSRGIWLRYTPSISLSGTDTDSTRVLYLSRDLLQVLMRWRQRRAIVGPVPVDYLRGSRLAIRSIHGGKPSPGDSIWH